MTTGLSTKDFLCLGPKETKNITVETAALHTLDEGGEFSVFAKGFLPYAEANSTELCGSITYESNKLAMTVDGKLASKTKKRVDKRTAVQGTCTGARLNDVKAALGDCNRLASAAAGAAASGTKLDTYFKSTSSATKNKIASRLRSVASDCAGGSATKTSCTDLYNGCSGNVLAYTVPSTNEIIYCSIFFEKLPAVANTCHGQDRATTVIHETTHAPGVVDPGTDDLGYGFDAATKLSQSQAIQNADSYALYANGKSNPTLLV